MYFKDGFRDEVAIIGMGCSKFGERWDTGLEDLIIEAAFEALALRMCRWPILPILPHPITAPVPR